ncbi:5'-nucleotidase [Cellulomonas sp. B6]|uniref:5'-nucleotidase n=1 Tax=Cellulomonas sp. B6 TaxID=1295626 RepID=UPI0009E6C3DD|nr:5'-nucleotidase [Cellulomonas sp. B6]
MPYELDHRLVVGVAPSALFDLRESDAAFKTSIDAYRSFQDEHIDKPMPKGAAFPFIERLLALNDLSPGDPLVEVILLAKDDAVTGLRHLKSLAFYGLKIERAVFTEGSAPSGYIKELNICLYLSGNRSDVARAVSNGLPAGLVLGRTARSEEDSDEAPGALRVAFDFDGVLADLEAQKVYDREKLPGFLAHEVRHASEPHQPGPMAQLVRALGKIQRKEIERHNSDPGYTPRVRIALVTARQAPAHERAIRTLRDWDVQFNDAFFLGGIEKAHVLRVLRPHIVFDDQLEHLESVAEEIAAVLVPYVGDDGGSNQEAPHASPAIRSRARSIVTRLTRRLRRG